MELQLILVHDLVGHVVYDTNIPPRKTKSCMNYYTCTCTSNKELMNLYKTMNIHYTCIYNVLVTGN